MTYLVEYKMSCYATIVFTYYIERNGRGIMANKVKKIIGTTALSLSLITGITGAVSASANDDLNSKKDNGVIITPYAIKDTLTWDLDGKTTDPTNSYHVTVGYPNVKLYASNTGAKSFRIEVKHNLKGKVIFNQVVPAGTSAQVINNDSSPTVPSGDYTITVYGGEGLPKGQIVLKASDTKWPSSF